MLAGIESGNYVEILKGVEAGENIVVSGQFLIDSEASMRASLTRLTDAAMSDASMAEAEMADMETASEEMDQ